MAPAALFVWIVCLTTSVVEGNGRGPIGLWAASDRFIVVADSSVPGLVVVDRKFDVAVERLEMAHVDATSFASCSSCNYGIMTASGGTMLVLYFEGDVETILHNYAKSEAQAALEAPPGTTPKLVPLNFLQKARVERVTSYTKKVVRDGRQVILHPEGRYGFLASSHDHSIYKLEVTPQSGHDDSSLHVNVTKFLEARKAMDPYGVSFVDGGKNILVAIHQKWLWRVDAETAEIRAKYSTQSCLPSQAFQRQAIDDHTSDASALLILASVPGSYDAVIWRLHYGPPSSEGDVASRKMSTVDCQVIVGASEQGPGWIDVLPPALDNTATAVNNPEGEAPSRGAGMKLSRAHHFVVVDQERDSHDMTLLASDIDNRALRVLQLDAQGLVSSSSIMYNQDYRINHEIPSQLRGGKLRGGGIASSSKSLPSCTAVEEDNAWSLKNVGMLHTYSVLGTPSLLRPASLDPAFSTQLSYREARGYCSYIGGRLCDSSELARTELAGASTASWTYAECASCWQAKETSTCNGIISNERTKGKNRNNHSAAHFHHSWNDGNAFFYKGETYCPGHAPHVVADAPCCRDCRTSLDQEEDDEDQ